MSHGRSAHSIIVWILVFLALIALQIIFTKILLTKGLNFPRLDFRCYRSFSSWISSSVQVVEVVLFIGGLIFLSLTWPIFVGVLFKRLKINAFGYASIWLVWASLTFIFFIDKRPHFQTRLEPDVSAQSAGRNAKLAEEVYYNAPDLTHPYPNNLASLLDYDRNLSDDPGVTFSFGTCDTSGYTFTTTHKCSCDKKVFTWTVL